MNSCQKVFTACVLAVLTQAVFAQEAPDLGDAAEFSVLGGTAVTCTAGVVTGDIGVAPGTAFTNTGCTVAGATPPATAANATQARADFLSAYAELQNSGPCIQVPGTLAAQNLAPGVYCTDATAKAGTLTLSGPADAVWIFRVAGALTGTDFSVAMAGGAQPCNVYWAPSAAVTMTTSAFKGNILAGDAADGSVTLTGGTLAGQVLANVAVTMTNASVIGCDALSDSPSPSCKGPKHRGKHHHGKKHHDKKHHDKHGHGHGNPFMSK